MKVRDLMTKEVIRIGPEESVGVAARTLEHYNIGALPVCGGDGRICGVVTDRDLVTRCLASGRSPRDTPVSAVMTQQIHYIKPDVEVSLAAEVMGRQQVRRLPVLENGKLCGMISLADLATQEESHGKAAEALADIASNISWR